MTLLNVYVSPERADIWTDGAYVEPDWTVRRFASKAVILGSIPAVVAVSGDGDVGIMAHQLLHDAFSNFDEMEEGVIDILRSVDQLRDGRSRLVLFWAGWSDKHNAVRGYATCSNCDIPNLPAWGRAQVWRWLQPNPPAFFGDLARIGIEPATDRPLSSDDAYRIAMEQRALRGLVPGHRDATAVGGFLQHTAVTKAGIYTRVVHRWPDRIGERIEAA